jgi:hypothetical protein
VLEVFFWNGEKKESKEIPLNLIYKVVGDLLEIKDQVYFYLMEVGVIGQAPNPNQGVENSRTL